MRYLPASPGPMETLGRARGGHAPGTDVLHDRPAARPGNRRARANAWYVVDKDLERNRLVVAQGHDHPALFKERLQAAQPTWIAGQPPQDQHAYTAKTRYRQPDAPCTWLRVEEHRAQVDFDAAAMGASRQASRWCSIEGEGCLGGGDHLLTCEGAPGDRRSCAAPGGFVAPGRCERPACRRSSRSSWRALASAVLKSHSGFPTALHASHPAHRPLAPRRPLLQQGLRP